MSADYPERSSTGKVVLIVVGIVAAVVLLLALVCGGIIWMFTRFVSQVASQASQAFSSVMASVAEVQAAETSARAFLDDIAAGQLESAYNRTSQNFRRGQPLKEFRAMIDKNPRVKGHITAQLVAQSMSSNPVIFTTTLTGPNGAVTCSLHVVKEGDQWKIDRFAFPPGEVETTAPAFPTAPARFPPSFTRQ